MTQLKIELQNHMLTLTTSDGQMAAINTINCGRRLQDVIAQWVLEVDGMIRDSDHEPELPLNGG